VAFTENDVEYEYLNYLDNLIEGSSYFDQNNGGIMLSEVMNSPSYPLKCAPEARGSDLFLSNITYPTTETNEASCAEHKEIVKVNWDYNQIREFEATDFLCLYSDGRLYDKIMAKDVSGAIANSATDERPSIGLGENAIKLIAHMTFDTDMDNEIKNNNPTKIGIVEGYKISDCGEGGACVERQSISRDFILRNQSKMESSSIMTWIYAPESTFNGGNIWADEKK